MSWGGKFALTTDHLPHIHAPAPGLYVGAGCNGRGVALASQIGPMLAQLCIGGAREELPIPVSAIAQIPFHSLRRPAIEAVALWYRTLDGLGR
jgi:glycine/D-amino acid oxidase-like deaminating enzyme